METYLLELRQGKWHPRERLLYDREGQLHIFPTVWLIEGHPYISHWNLVNDYQLWVQVRGTKVREEARGAKAREEQNPEERLSQLKPETRKLSGYFLELI